MSLMSRGVLSLFCTCLIACVALGAVQEAPTKDEQMKEIATALSGVEPPASQFDFVTFDLARTTVILRGFTVGEKRKEACAAAVKEVSWVGHVLNYIEALSDSYRDEKLRENIRFVLRQRAKKLYDSGSGRIRIKVNEGNVTLIGVVDEEHVELLERAVAEMRVEELALSVENKVTVRK